MRRVLLGALRILVPLALGIWLVYHFHDALSPEQREELYNSFIKADWRWLAGTMLLGWISHISRAWRWRYLLDHLGHKVGPWNAYHATMIGYFMNMLLPRVGEASRALTLHRTEKVPFEKGFGTIMAERAVDMIMLTGITAVTLALQWDKLHLFQERIEAFRNDGAADNAASGSPTGIWILMGATILLGTLAVLAWSRPAIRSRIQSALHGFMQGLWSVFATRHKGAFVLHTIIIWASYVLMFAMGFQALDGTSVVPIAGILAGFIAGSVGIILVQGGLGAYPAFVAVIVSIYMAPPEGGGTVRPDALAMGWLLWTAQTVMIIVLGGLSLLLVSRSRKRSHP